jgi:NAD(P)-dependent dehydrogenase (short-subunit alcohol dehydrogenase family)
MAETRVALISGANKGIGLEITRELARLGMIAVMGSRSQAKGEAALEPLTKEGLIASVVELDVTDDQSVRAAVASVMSLFGRIDVVVNNAGIFLDGANGAPSNVAALTPDVMRATFETNVIGPLRLMQAVLPIMREQDYGRIVNLSSGAGQLCDMGAGYPAYRISKTALNALTVTTAAEVGPGNVKINAMCPGWVKTDMGGPDAPRSVAEGAETAVWLASLPADGPNGGYFRDKKRISW